MSKEISLEDTVPHEFWDAIRPMHFNPECQSDLVSFHKLLLDGDMAGANEKEKIILQGLESAHVGSRASTSLSYKLQFDNLALHFSGKIFACADESEIYPTYHKELAVYFGVLGAKRRLGRYMSPSGFKTSHMPRILFARYANQRTQSDPVNSELKSSITCTSLDLKYAAPNEPSELLLSTAMITELRQSSMSWVRTPSGNWFNFSRAFDTRTKE